jgi:hypothetical protein
MHHKPCGLVRDSNSAVNLVGADAVFARIEHVCSHPPFREGNLAALEHGADRDGELALALIAIV